MAKKPSRKKLAPKKAARKPARKKATKNTPVRKASTRNTLTTPLPSIDVDGLVPKLASLARTTVLLHPREVARDPELEASKMGGRLLWPSAEPWPSCPEHQSPFLGVMQLRKEDVPELGFPARKDLFQLTWCPKRHEPEGRPLVRIVWRNSDSVHTPLRSVPRVDGAEPDFVPRACQLRPERVREYPHRWELEYGDVPKPKIVKEISQIDITGISDYQERMDRLQDDYEPIVHYQYDLCTAPGTKVAGYPRWLQGAKYPKCSCGKLMEFLLAIDPDECGAFYQWMPLEEQAAIAGKGKRVTATVAQAARKKLPRGQHSLLRSHGMEFGDGGIGYFFICRKCVSDAVATIWQSC